MFNQNVGNRLGYSDNNRTINRVVCSKVLWLKKECIWFFSLDLVDQGVVLYCEKLEVRQDFLLQNLRWCEDQREEFGT